MEKLKSWFGQVTTGHGFMILVPTVLAILNGSLTWQQGVPMLLAGLVGLIWPENAALSADARQLAQDSIAAWETRRKAMALVLASLLISMTLTACSVPQVQTAASSPAGQLFCSIQTSGGGSLVAGIIDAEATALLPPGASPVAVLATNKTAAFVSSKCAAAAASVGGVSGVPVSPPANPAAAPVVAVPAATTGTDGTSAPAKS